MSKKQFHHFVPSFLSGVEGRAPHGLAYLNPRAFSPSAYEFFHPNTSTPDTYVPCAASDCSPLPLAAVVQATEAHQSQLSTPKTSRSRVGAGGIAAILFSFVFVVLLAMGVYYVVITRRANLTRSNSVKPDA
ncbi:hypothetical protein HHK36_016608 [Tetracentron sinense]|uniref:Uncharacterized protein n=1 Tax=Tetracentron sinense TaxID=13715 RepID=A0A834Z630_TETSI|nr:hypothetical protein HHK36_016608 [Tetracentron sinense]